MEFLPDSARGWTLDDESGPVTKPLFLGLNWAAFHADITPSAVSIPFSDPAQPREHRSGTGDAERLLDAGCEGRYVPDAKVCHWVPRKRCSPRWAFPGCIAPASAAD